MYAKEMIKLAAEGTRFRRQNLTQRLAEESRRKTLEKTDLAAKARQREIDKYLGGRREFRRVLPKIGTYHTGTKEKIKREFRRFGGRESAREVGKTFRKSRSAQQRYRLGKRQAFLDRAADLRQMAQNERKEDLRKLTKAGVDREYMFHPKHKYPEGRVRPGPGSKILRASDIRRAAGSKGVKGMLAKILRRT